MIAKQVEYGRFELEIELSEDKCQFNQAIPLKNSASRQVWI